MGFAAVTSGVAPLALLLSPRPVGQLRTHTVLARRRIVRRSESREPSDVLALWHGRQVFCQTWASDTRWKACPPRVMTIPCQASRCKGSSSNRQASILDGRSRVISTNARNPRRSIHAGPVALHGQLALPAARRRDRHGRGHPSLWHSSSTLRPAWVGRTANPHCTGSGGNTCGGTGPGFEMDARGEARTLEAGAHPATDAVLAATRAAAQPGIALHSTLPAFKPVRESPHARFAERGEESWSR